MQSLQKELLENIKQAYPNSQSLDNLFAISQMLGHKDSLCERKLRLLVQSKLVEVLKDDKKQNYAYKWIKPTIEVVRRPEVIEPFEDLRNPEGFYFKSSGVPDCFKGKAKNTFKEKTLSQFRLGFSLPPVRE